MRSGAGTQPTLTWEEMDAIGRDVPGVRLVAPLLSRCAQVVAEQGNWATQIQGTTPEYFELRDWGAGRGTLFTWEEVRAGQKVAVLGHTVAENLFDPFTDPVGQVVRVNNVPFEVIGVAAEKGETGFGGDQDDAIFVPLSAFRARLSGDLNQYLNGRIHVSATSQEELAPVQARIEALLRTRHRIDEGMDDDFSVRNLADAEAAQQAGAQVMTSLLAGIALVSLIVGGIGIMNIMLVSVTERTREIGLRMAVGAKPRQVLLQFMVESVSLSVIGGLIGLSVGVGGAYLIARQFGWPVAVDPNAAILAITSSALVGVGFGLYPAFRASRLDPIQALRYE
jgi:putative ABC transport system permease protein